MSDILLDAPLDSQQREYAETVRNSANGTNALLAVLNDIRNFSKIEAGKLHFEQVDSDLCEAVEESVELLARQAAENGLELAALVARSAASWSGAPPARSAKCYSTWWVMR